MKLAGRSMLSLARHGTSRERTGDRDTSGQENTTKAEKWEERRHAKDEHDATFCRATDSSDLSFFRLRPDGDHKPKCHSSPRCLDGQRRPCSSSSGSETNSGGRRANEWFLSC